MKRPSRKLASIIVSSATLMLIVFGGYGLLAGQLDKQAAATKPVPAITPYIETHTHFDGQRIASFGRRLRG